LDALDVEPNRIKLIFSNETGRFLEQKEWVQFMACYGVNETASGQVEAFTKINKTLRLNRAPDKDYKLSIFHYKPLPLAISEADVFPWPAEYEDVIIDGICAHVAHSLGRSEAGDYFMLQEEAATRFVADQRIDFGLPRVMPRVF
jgi:hypothetical protein